jgi:methionine-R-sulfoxide reductase
MSELAPPEVAPAAPRDAPRRRIGGVDLARALAILGMLAVHIGPTGHDDLAGRLYALPHGRASILFVLVAGVGITLLAASRSSTLAEARVRLAWRAALLLPLGLLLQELDHRVFVILQTYGALFLLAIALLRLPHRALLALAVVLATVGPVVHLLGRMLVPETFARTAVAWSDPAATIAVRLAVAGPYPLLVWAAPLALGMWIGRLDLRSWAWRVWLVVAGIAAAVLAPALAGLAELVWGAPGRVPAWSTLLLATPHSQMPPWVISSLGSGALVLGLSLIAADLLPRLTWPLVAMGQLALTVYVGHLLALHWWSPVLRSGDVGEASVRVLALGTAAAAVATLWRARFRRGPLEALLDVPGRATVRWWRRRAATPPHGEERGMIVARRSTVADVLRLTDEEWRRRLTPEEYRVLRQHGTERPFEGCFVGTHEPGTYVCAGCGNPLFAAGVKFESGTGWPSFTQPVSDDAVTEVDDFSYGMVRTEVRCARCESHLGHVFPDGPPPTGLRYCMNSIAMRHVPEGEPLEVVSA